MALGISLKTVATFIELLIPWGMSYMFQNIVPTNNVGLIFAWGGVLFAIAGITVLCNVIANRNACLVSRHATERIRLQLFAKMNYLSEEAQSEITGESLISRATSDTYNVHRFLGMVQRMGVRQPMVLLGSLVITFFMDPKLTLVLLIMIPVMAVTIVLFMKYGQPLFKKVQEAQDTFVRIVREDVNGIRVIKALSKGDTEKKRFNDVNNEVVRKNQFANNVMGGMHPLVRILLNIGMILVVYVGAKLVLKGDSTAETVLAFMTYVQMILNALIFMSRFFLMYTEASVSANRISEVMSKENTLYTEPETESEETIENRAKESAIEFKNVSFGYGKNSDSVKNISFSVKRGETLGIIGATGSGKSTLVSLLMRYYDVRQGNVYVDGRDVRTYEDADLKCKFGAVFQNDIIFCESIRDNIKFGRDISDETILKAADAA